MKNMIDSKILYSPEIICFGEALVDRLGPIGGNLNDQSLCDDYLGGAPANVACALARLGLNISFIGCLGDDDIGKSFVDLMLSRNINIEGVQINSRFPTRVVLVKRDRNGERSFHGFEGDQGEGFADQEIELNPIIKKWKFLSKKAKWLLIGTIPLAKNSSANSLKWCVDSAIKSGIKIALDINWRPKFWDLSLNSDSGPNQLAIETIKPIVDKVSFLKLAKEEAISFFNTSDPSLISSSLPLGPDVVVTDGGNPIKWCFQKKIGETYPVKTISILDTTGAGDAFTAGLLYQFISLDRDLLSSSTIQEMVAFAAACGAIVCQGAGAIEPQPNLEQVKLFMDSFKI